MRILMLSWEYPPRIVGGISRVVYDLTQKLSAENHEVHVVTCWESGMQEYEKDKGINIYRIKAIEIGANNFIDWVLHLNFSMLEQCIKIINGSCNGDDNDGTKIDIIHAHDWIVAYCAKVLKHSYKIPMVCTIHATEHGRNGGIYNEMQRYIHNVEWFLTYEAWKVICNSNFMKDELGNIFSIPEEKIKVIPNGVDIKKYEKLERDIEFRRNFANDNEKIIFFVGRLVQEKGVHILIDAIPKIVRSYNDIKVVIVGKGNQFDYLKYRAQENGIDQKVYLTGYMCDDDLQKLYKCIDIAVFPSLYEPFGIVALEAMATNIPVVVTDIGGLNEIVEHGGNGMKAYAGNSNSLADCIIELLYNPLLCERLKENARKKILERYNYDIIAKKTIEIYESIVKERAEINWI